MKRLKGGQWLENGGFLGFLCSLSAIGQEPTVGHVRPKYSEEEIK